MPLKEFLKQYKTQIMTAIIGLCTMVIQYWGARIVGAINDMKSEYADMRKTTQDYTKWKTVAQDSFKTVGLAIGEIHERETSDKETYSNINRIQDDRITANKSDADIRFATLFEWKNNLKK